MAVTRLLGQAARGAARGFARLMQGVLALALGAAVVAVVLASAMAWRLAQGPLEVGWAARAAEAAFNRGDPPTLRIGSAALRWDAWRAGADRPLELSVTEVALLDGGGATAARLRRGAVSLSPESLLTGRVVPRTVDLDGARLTVRRAADGTTTLDLGGSASPATSSRGNGGNGPQAILDEMTRPPQGDGTPSGSPWSQLRRIRVRDAAIVVADRQLGADWSVPSLQVELRRRDTGGVEGDGEARATLADQTLTLTLQASPASDGGGSDLRARLTPFTPATLATRAPGLAALAALDAPLAISAQASVDQQLRPRGVAVHAEVEAGTAHIARGTMPIVSAAVDARISPEGGIEATLARLVTAPRPDGPRTTIRATLHAARDGAGYGATVAVDLDQAAFADLPAIWAEGLGGKGTRPWITTNITAGTARNLHVEAKLAVPADFSDAEPLSVTGGLDGTDLTVHWLRPVPPIEHADARLTVVDPQTLEVAVLSGREAEGAHGGIVIRRGLVRVTGLADKDQYADISADLTGPLPDLLTLLKNPKIRLLDKRPMEMRDPAGRFDGKLTVNRLVFRNDVSMDDLQIHTNTRLTDVHLGGIAAGRDIDRGTLDLDAGNDGLTVKGDARVAGIPTQLAIAMDFRNGPPSEVLLKVTASATADESQLAALGADPSGIVAGPVAVQLGYQSRRDGSGDITLHADLARTVVMVARAHVRKAAGSPATADLHATLDHDRLAAIDRVLIRGDGILVQGAADVAGGKPNVLKLDRIKLGDTTDAHGEIRLPRRDGDGYGVDLAGPSIDLSGEFGKRDGAPAPARPEPPTDKTPPPDKPGTPYTATVRFDRVIVAGGQSLGDVNGHVEHDGRIIRHARISGRTGPSAPFQAAVEPSRGGRALSASAADLGALLRGADIVSDVTGGRLAVQGAFDDTQSDHPLTGTVDLGAFRVRGAAALGKILQGLTLYGMVDVLSGPGLNFDRLAGSFRFARDVVEIQDARAFSSSLGLTAAGRVDLGRDTLDLTGTVVPAYFLNSLLGRIPLVGRLFSPERGGGVVAVTYAIHGPMSDPSIGINPLSALTPGFLRGFFDIFDRAEGGSAPSR